MTDLERAAARVAASPDLAGLGPDAATDDGAAVLAVMFPRSTASARLAAMREALGIAATKLDSGSDGVKDREPPPTRRRSSVRIRRAAHRAPTAARRAARSTRRIAARTTPLGLAARGALIAVAFRVLQNPGIVTAPLGAARRGVEWIMDPAAQWPRPPAE